MNLLYLAITWFCDAFCALLLVQLTLLGTERVHEALFEPHAKYYYGSIAVPVNKGMPEKSQEYKELIAKGDAASSSDPLKAASYYEKAFAMNPADSSALGKKIDVLARHGHGEVALDDANKLVDLFPNDAVSYYMRGLALSYLNEHYQAEEDFAWAISKDPKMAQAYQNLGFTLVALGRHREAVDMYADAVRLCPDDEESVYYLCVELEEIGKYDRAMKVLEDYMPYNKLRNYSIYHHIGRVHGLLGNQKESFENYVKSVRLNPPDKDSTSYVKKHYKEITKCQKTISKMDPYDPTSFYKAGQILLEKNWDDTALYMLKTGVLFMPVARVYDTIAMIHMNRLEYVEAAKYWRLALSMPNEPKQNMSNRYVALLKCLFEYGMFSEVSKCCKEAISRGIMDPEIRNYLYIVQNDDECKVDRDPVLDGMTIRYIW